MVARGSKQQRAALFFPTKIKAAALYVLLSVLKIGPLHAALPYNIMQGSPCLRMKQLLYDRMPFLAQVTGDCTAHQILWSSRAFLCWFFVGVSGVRCYLVGCGAMTSELFSLMLLVMEPLQRIHR